MNEAHTTHSRSEPNSPVLSVRGLSKFYPGVIALDSVDLDLYAGSSHALVGENGAGKSTLIKMLAGAIRPDAGTISLAGRTTRFPNPVSARRAGIAVVHQHTHLIPDLTLAENFGLREGYPRNPLGLINWKQLHHRAASAVHVMIPGMDVGRRASSLSGVEKQMVEIGFALAAKPAVLVLDEPTAILPYAESDRLFRMVRSFLAGGGSVLYVSHRLDEVFALCDRVTVLRDGRRVWSKPAPETNHDDLIQAMVGRGVSFDRDETLQPGTDALLKVDNLSDKNGCFRDVSVEVRAGEIYGIYGLVGAGQSELCAALLGLRSAVGSAEIVRDPADGGAISLNRLSSGARVRRGLAMVPAERLERGMFRQMTVGENMSIASLGRKSALGLVRTRTESRDNARFMQELRVKATGPHQNAIQLSGGNQQKVLLARWLQTEPRVLILEEPTQGVDVGAKMEIHRLIREQARRGVAVLLVSSEMPELLALSHRIGIMRQGSLVQEMPGEAATEESILKVALPPQENMPEEVDLAPMYGQSHESATTETPNPAEQTSPSAPADEAPVGQTSPSSPADAPPVGRTFLSVPYKTQSPTRTDKNVRPTQSRRQPRRRTLRREAGLLALLVLIIVAASVFVPNFATWANFRDILKNQSILLLGALGVGAVIIAGGIDISIGAILGLAALAAAKMDLGAHPTAFIWLFPLAVGGALGALNGLLTVYGRVHSIVVTLGMMFILQGLMLEIMGNRWLFNLSNRITDIGRGEYFGGLSNLIWFGAGGVALSVMLLGYTVTGRRWYALGGDSASAQLLGVNPRTSLPLAFAFSGLLIGLAGLLQAAFNGQVQTNTGRGYELEAIAAAVIGGVHIMGGRGTAFGILIGALLLGVISNLLVFLHVSAYWDNAITGAVILIAVCADALGTRRERNAA